MLCKQELRGADYKTFIEDGSTRILEMSAPVIVLDYKLVRQKKELEKLSSPRHNPPLKIVYLKTMVSYPSAFIKHQKDSSSSLTYADLEIIKAILRIGFWLQCNIELTLAFK